MFWYFYFWYKTQCWHWISLRVKPMFAVIHFDQVTHLWFRQFHDAACCLFIRGWFVTRAMPDNVYILSSRGRWLTRFTKLFLLWAVAKMETPKSICFYKLWEIISQVTRMILRRNIANNSINTRRFADSVTGRRHVGWRGEVLKSGTTRNDPERVSPIWSVYTMGRY